MTKIHYVVSPRPGGNLRGALGTQGNSLALIPGGGHEVSLNLTPADISRYDRIGDDLQITLADGRIVVLEGYFDGDSYGANRLFLSTDGVINEVSFADINCVALEPQYGPTEAWGKWNPHNELIFHDQPVTSLIAADGDFDLLYPIAGAVGLGLLLTTEGRDNPAPPRIVPRVDDADAVIRFGGDDTRALLITGIAAPGSDISVKIDGVTMSAVANEKRGWSVAFEGAAFPDDGSYSDIEVTVREPDGTVTKLDGPSYLIDTTPPQIRVDQGSVSSDDLFNAVSHADGVTVSGRAEVGSTVAITLDTMTSSCVVGANGRWSFTFDEDVLPAGEYTSEFTVTATDSFGNTTTLSDSVQIDTVADPLTIDSVTGDNLLSARDGASDFAITGTSAPGAMINVSFAGITRNVVTGEDGVWSMPIAAGELPGGEYDTSATATTVDAAGNIATRTVELLVDTVTFVTLEDTPLTGDDVFNLAELRAGKTLTGTGEVGATVVVTFGDPAPGLFSVAEGELTGSAVVGADGSWTIRFTPAAISGAGRSAPLSSGLVSVLPTGTYDTTVNVVAVDAAGNRASLVHDFRIDTETTITVNTATVEGDGIVNAAERADGIVLTGRGEPGASVVLSVEGVEFSAVVDAAGDWFVTLPAAILPTGSYSLSVAATATDTAGNVARDAGSIGVDTRTTVSVDADGVERDGIVNAAERADGVTLTGQAEAGAVVRVTLGAVTHVVTTASDGNWSTDFAAAEIPSGERVLTATAVSTDAAGNTATASDTITIDTLVSGFASTLVPGGSDRIVNLAEAGRGITFGGTTEPGSSVKVTLAGVQNTATVSADGNWSVTFDRGQLPSGERNATMTAVATDSAGNTDTITQSVRFDTDAGVLTIDRAPVEGNDVVNFQEAADGVVLTGTSNPGQAVQVTMAGVTVNVVTDAAGNWRAPFNAAEVAPGTYVAQITATTADIAGNTLTVTDSVQVDTSVINFAIASAPILGDGIVNAGEATSGVRLSGTVERGASVEIMFRGVKYAADTDAAGNWLVEIPGIAIPRGETAEPVLVKTTDLAGNTAQLTSVLTIDTEVSRLTVDDSLFTSDDVLNAREVDLGLTLTGQVEAGSTVLVTLGSVTHVADVDQAGNWSVDIPGDEMPRGTLAADILIAATDLAGNTRSMTQSVSVDTDEPGAPVWVDYTRGHLGLNSITLDTVPYTVEIGRLVTGPGGMSVVDLGVTSSFDIPDVGTYHRFDGSVPDGSHLVVSYSDNVGNETGAFLVTDNPASSEVRFTDQMAQRLGAFDVELINLDFAEDTNLTLTEYQIQTLSNTTDTVVILGGSDDSVTIVGASRAGTTEVDGQSFSLYTLGDASILLDADITNVNIGVV